ncbi:PAS domain S-box protein [Craurococcus roseus]|uniref:histidine kinase n=1 Tax=Craurococcus roseus TaxID=77585 RepID=A0ABN1F846_9PROT
MPAFIRGTDAISVLMRTRDWSASPLGHPADWPQSLRSVVGLMLGSKFPMFVAWGPDLGLLYNEPYAEILGAKHPAALGRPFRNIWAEIWPDIGPLIETAMAGQATFREDLPLVMNRKGFDEQTWFTFSYSPVRDEGGAVAGMFCACTETTGKVLAERRLTAEGEGLRRLFHQAPGFMCMLRGRDHVFELANAAFLQLVGHRDLVGMTVREAMPDVQGQGFFELLDHAFATGEAFVGRRKPIALQRTPGGPADERFVDFVYQPIRDAEGRVTGIFVEGSDVTEHVRHEEALSAGNARIAALLDTMGEGFFVLDQEFWITEINAEGLRLDGRSESEIVGRTLWEVWPEANGTQVEAAYRRAMAERVPVSLEHNHRTDRHNLWLDLRIHPVPGGGLAAFYRDVTARREAEARRDLLAREVDHRAKNALAVVQAALRLTRADDVPGYVAAVEGRVGALARAQTLLAYDRWGGADLRELLQAELEPFLGGDGAGASDQGAGPRVELAGPPVAVPAGAAQPLAMAMHELATNAVKHGALSAPAGRVSVSWRSGGDSSTDGVLLLRWEEAGGPSVRGAPERRGFGSRVIEGTLSRQLRGTVRRAWEAGGLVCDIELPLPRAGEKDAGPAAANLPGPPARLPANTQANGTKWLQ